MSGSHRIASRAGAAPRRGVSERVRRRAGSRIAGLLGCCALGCATATPSVDTGPAAITTPDGLHRVENVPQGTLYMKPDYRVGSYDAFLLGHTMVTFEAGSRKLEESQVAQIRRRFDDVAREVISGGGTPEVSEAGPCVALINLAMIDLDLLDPKQLSGTRTSVLRSFGALTLVLEIRDSHTHEPLLRFGRRRRLEGGAGTGADPATGAALSQAFRSFAYEFQRDFQRSLPRVESSTPVLGCRERARLAEDARAR